MRAEQRTQIRKILEYQSATAMRQLEERRAALYADHSAKGVPQSGATIRGVIRAMEEVAAAFVSNSIEQVIAVAQDVEAFAALSDGCNAFWNWQAAELQSTINLASGRHVTDDQPDDASRAALKLFEKSRALVSQKLELYRFTFTRPVPNEGLALSVAKTEVDKAPETTVKKKGGRLLAEHWDDMWASIAVALYTGDLKPKNQGAIEVAMLSWLEDNGHSAAISTVRGRARKLWDRIERDD